MSGEKGYMELHRGPGLFCNLVSGSIDTHLVTIR